MICLVKDSHSFLVLLGSWLKWNGTVFASYFTTVWLESENILGWFTERNVNLKTWIAKGWHWVLMKGDPALIKLVNQAFLSHKRIDDNLSTSFYTDSVKSTLLFIHMLPPFSDWQISRTFQACVPHFSVILSVFYLTNLKSI